MRITRDPRAILAFAALVLSLAVFGMQLRTLYTVPVFDAARWGGDETWLMREFVHQAQHGVLMYPESFGEPVRTNGVLAGSMWGNMLIYGVPGIIFFPSYDYVSIGRTVTAILALLLIGSLYFIARSLRISPLAGAMIVFLMALSQGFIWASHSARYDLLTGLILIWYCYYLSKIERCGVWQMFVAGAMGIVTVCFSPHLLTLAGAASIAFLIRNSVWRRPSALLACLAGTIAAVVILSIVYFIGSGEFSLFGRGGKAGIFSFVLNEIPIVRPFSRNVQLSNLMERFHLFRSDLPGIVTLLAISIFLILLLVIRQRRIRVSAESLRHSFTTQHKFFLLCTALCSLSWLLVEGSRPYYLFHIAPLLLIGFGIMFERLQEIAQPRWFEEIIMTFFVIIPTMMGAPRVIPWPALGDSIAHDQQAAISKFLRESRSSTSQKSRILFDVAGLDRALMDTSSQLLTLDMFQPPANAELLVNKLRSNNIDYVVLRSSPVGTAFEPGRALIPHVLDSIGIVQDSALGFFYDDGRNYDASIKELRDQRFDTLRLYRVRKN